MKIAVAGASGNLGLPLCRHLLEASHDLVLLWHRRPIPRDLVCRKNVVVRNVDLANRYSLRGALDGADAVISLAGVLFRANPKEFLPLTNSVYVKNLADEAVLARVRKFVLLSFPHVEGPSTPEHRALGVLPDTEPTAVHARTRLEAERYVIRCCDASDMHGVIARCGVVYGAGTKLMMAARRYLKCRALFIWREPTWVHLIALPDLLDILRVCVEQADLDGIVNIGDDLPLQLQCFLDRLADHWGYARPIRLPLSFFRAAAHCFDYGGRLLRCPIPLNPDILQMGLTSAVADTARLKTELQFKLKYATFTEGIRIC